MLPIVAAYRELMVDTTVAPIGSGARGNDG
jgi:hypothetical protein